MLHLNGDNISFECFSLFVFISYHYAEFVEFFFVSADVIIML